MNGAAAIKELKSKLEEVKQKIMGSFYVLLKMQKDFTIDEILGISNGARMPSSLSFCQCFSDVIATRKRQLFYLETTGFILKLYVTNSECENVFPENLDVLIIERIIH